MSHITLNGARLYYEEHGRGPQAIVFCHSMLFSCRMFDAQVEALKDRYRCLMFDFRGQDQSEVTEDGYDLDTLSEDTAAFIEAMADPPCHFLGFSMGGMVGLRLAIRRPELLRSLMRVLIDQTIDRAAAAIEAASCPEDKLVASWKELFSAVTESGFLLDLTSVKQEVVALASDLIKDFDRRYKVLIRKIISDGVEQGVFHVNDVELAVAALSSGAVGLITTVAGEAEYEIIERRIEELGELLMNGLRKR